jgi:hypothetical protein
MLWWRKVRNHSYWTPGVDQHSEGVSYYVHDVALRRQSNEQGLSLYAVADESEANQIANYYALTQMGRTNLDYLLIPDGPWNSIGLSPTKSPIETLPPFLAGRHYEVFELTEDLESRLAAAILADEGRTAHRLTKRTVQTAAQCYLDGDQTLRQYLHEEWAARLPRPG